MKFISAEEFLKQPKEVQEILINCWQPEFGDLFTTKMVSDEIDIIINTDNDDIYGLNDTFKGNIYDYVDKTLKIIPLFTEGQLIQFIEDKTNCKIELDISSDIGYKGYNLYLRKNWGNDGYEYPYKPFENLSNNLLQALWEVACKIAQKEINNQKQSIVSTNKQGLPVIKGGGKTMREMCNDEYR